MALVDSSIDGTMTVIVLDADERQALDDFFGDHMDQGGIIPGILEEFWQAL